MAPKRPLGPVARRPSRGASHSVAVDVPSGGLAEKAGGTGWASLRSTTAKRHYHYHCIAELRPY